MKRRREGDDVWRKEDREVAGVEKGKWIKGTEDLRVFPSSRYLAPI
jgi:hypothetical protein